jgi:hypothetical protein
LNTGIVNIKGKEYQTVALRVQKFREAHPDWELSTEIIKADDTVVIMQAQHLQQTRASCIATGHAEEFRASSQINSTSALENAETSAIGRCLAAAGWGGMEFGSANEVQNAIHQQATPKKRATKTKEELVKLINEASSPEILSVFWKALSPEERELVRAEAAHKGAELKESKGVLKIGVLRDA